MYTLQKDQIPFDGSPVKIVLTRRETGKARIRFEKADGTPAANATYFYASADGKGGSGSRLKDSSGVLELEIAEGSYVMHGATGNCLDSQTPFEVRAGEVVEVTARQATPGRLEGTVVDPEGAPLVGARIRVSNWHGFDPCPRLEPTTDESGRFEIDLPPGRFTFYINAAWRRGPYEIRSGETTTANIEVKPRR